MSKGKNIAKYTAIGVLGTIVSIPVLIATLIEITIVVVLLLFAADAILPDPTPQQWYARSRDSIEEEVSVELEDGVLIRYEDTHEPPFGDGDRIVIVQVDDVQETILQIERTGQWNQLPLNEQGEEALGSLLQWFPDTQISTEHGYWFFLDRYAEKYGEPSSYSRNFTFCVFDTDSGLFYYYEYDS